jgi:tRNA uridine 5-carbamoylmethylation protein Kti12
MRRAICMSGCSGSGKSTYAARLVANNWDGDGTIVSADHYMIDTDGVYRFGVGKLAMAHAVCLRDFIAALGRGVSLVLCDNTNTTVSELKPYQLAAVACGYDFEVITVRCDVEKAAARNRHGVPIDRVRKQAERIARRQLPAEWKHSEVGAE